MSKAKADGRVSAFTLVELLIVIAIIGVLIAILLPTLSKARRSAQVLASPVLYRGTDQAVHLTDPSGAADLVIAKWGNSGCPVCHSPPTWAPNGQMIGFTNTLTGSTGYRSALLEPVSGKVKPYSTSSNNFVGWLDSQRYLVSNSPSTASIVRVDNGKALTISNSALQFEFISTAPDLAPAPLVGMYYDTRTSSDKIAWFRKNLQPARLIWAQARGSSGTQQQSQVSPRVDAMGEYVAWTLWRNNRPYVAIKGARRPSNEPPTLLGDAYSSAYFCDFTEQGDLLCNVRDSRQRLVILRRDGKFVRELSLSIPPADGVVASWRKYEHR